jgi:phosphoribosyl 1,2-cyclic phosphate phosphodiesterase
MRMTILGCGAAGGTPMISVGWGRCNPDNPRNRRRRPSILVDEGATTILVDTGPDVREQLLGAAVRRLDGVLYTHAHADHVHGIDDLREVNRAMRAPIDVYGSPATLDEVRQRFGYAFESLPAGVTQIYKPLLRPHTIDGPFTIGPVDVLPFDQDHGYCRSTGFRFGRMAYSTDLVDLPEESLAVLEHLDLWVVGCLLETPHATHAHIDKALAWVERLKPKLTLITHMSPQLDYDHLSAYLPAGVAPAYDGQIIEV